MMSSGDFAVYDDKDEKFVTLLFLFYKVSRLSITKGQKIQMVVE